MFALKDIIKTINGVPVNTDKDGIIEAISTNSRTILPNELFLAIKGNNFDGHDYVREAIKKGAKAAIVSKNEFLETDLPIIKVENTLKALGDIASYHRWNMVTTIIGITGSNGKTTTKDMIAHIIRMRHKVVKTYKTENNIIGVSRTLLSARDEEYIVIEMGTSAPGELGRLAKIIRPDIGVITNIGHAHLEGFADINGILDEKSTILDNLQTDGVAVINKDDALLDKLKINNRVITFGIKSRTSDFFADEIKNTENGIEFTVNKEHRFTLPVFGTHNIYNALCAIVVAHVLGLSMDDCRQAFLNYRPAKMRFDIFKHSGMNIINDAYNSNPLSMKAALDTLAALKTRGRKIVVAADMLELGKNTNSLHYEVGRLVAKKGIDMLVTVGELAKNIAKGAIENKMDSNSVKGFLDREQAAKFLFSVSRQDDTILVKGSRKMKMEDFIECFTTSCTH